MRIIISEIFRGRFFGHPIHMMLVHFPTALLPMSAGFDIAGIYFNDENLVLFSFFCGAAGIVLGFFALLFGAGDLLKISPLYLPQRGSEKSSMPHNVIEDKILSKALLHGGLNLTWLLVFSVIIGIDLKTYPDINLPSTGQILIKVCVVTGMLYSNFLGGELVLKHDIGKIPPSPPDK